jgi:hypothetical protein
MDGRTHVRDDLQRIRSQMKDTVSVACTHRLARYTSVPVHTQRNRGSANRVVEYMEGSTQMCLQTARTTTRCPGRQRE